MVTCTEEVNSSGNQDRGTKETTTSAKKKGSEPTTTTKTNITKECGKTVDNTATVPSSKKGTKFSTEDGVTVPPSDLETTSNDKPLY